MDFSPISFDVEVIFGAPAKRCDGAGICQLIPVGPVRVHWKCPNARATLIARAPGEVCLQFSKQHLGACLQQRYFALNKFEVEEDYTFPAIIHTRLNLPGFKVKSGRYAVKVSEEYVEVSFLSN